MILIDLIYIYIHICKHTLYINIQLPSFHSPGLKPWREVGLAGLELVVAGEKKYPSKFPLQKFRGCRATVPALGLKL